MGRGKGGVSRARVTNVYNLRADRTFYELFEGPFDVYVLCRRCLLKQNSILACDPCCLLGRDLSSFDEVELIAYEHDDDVGFSISLEFFEPVGNIFKSAASGEVIDNESSHRFAIMAADQQMMYAVVIALYFSSPAVSQICALM